MASMLLGEELTPSLTPTLQRAAVGAPATLEVVARNALASVYAVRLPPGCVGVDLKFRNETRPAGRVEVAMVRGGPAAAGVRVGDMASADMRGCRFEHNGVLGGAAVALEQCARVRVRAWWRCRGGPSWLALKDTWMVAG